MNSLPDSGTRSEFTTGAVRDGEAGKGRFDLLPEQALELFDNDLTAYDIMHGNAYLATGKIVAGLYDGDRLQALTDLARRFEDGAEKYTARNWEMGIPTHRYIDSALRHLAKFEAGELDEDHRAAVLWNVICLDWTLAKIRNGELPGELNTQC